MEYALQVIGAYDHVLEIARVCERNGAPAVALADHYLYGKDDAGYASAPAYDSLVQAAALGRDTSGIEIVMLVSPITFRHPAVYAKTAITLDELSGGRFVLGLGTGWHDDEHGHFDIPYPDRNERFHMLEDALGYVYAFFHSPQGGFDSKRYSFKGLSYLPAARADMRLLVGGSGAQRTPRLAGTYGGEYSLAGTEPEDVAAKVAVMRDAAEKAGRSPDEILITISSVVVSGDTHDEVTENIGRVDDSERSAQDARESWEKRGIVFRTWEEHRDRFGRYAEAGVERTYLQLVGKNVELSEEALQKLGS